MSAGKHGDHSTANDFALSHENPTDFRFDSSDIIAKMG
jgi:hypothetical protein